MASIKPKNGIKEKNSSREISPAPPVHPYKVSVSKRFIVLTFLPCILLSFGVGRFARFYLIDRPFQDVVLKLQQSLLESNTLQVQQELNLPSPKLQNGKIAPKTEYTSKNFDTAKASTINSRWILTEAGIKECEGEDAQDCPAPVMDKDGDGDEETEELHLPAGQHLLLDYENIDPEFLNSEERLANAMLELVNTCGLTLLSYHCHSLKPSGVSCAGVLLESHVSFHTWPSHGVITLDLYTCGPNSLLPILDMAEDLFSIPDPNNPKPPHLIWLYKLRGFRDNGDGNADLTDMMWFPVGQRTHYKKEIVAEESAFQSIHIFDALKPYFQDFDQYMNSLSSGNETYEAQNPGYFAPDRLVFLDGILQSRRSGDAAYHEALVHPAMFAHRNPKRVAIVGGGEGATLREVLKHNTVEKVVMVEIDELIVKISKESLPEWNDCSSLAGSTPSCFDDPRTDLQLTDAFAWFIDRFGEDGSKKGSEPKFDVIIMDALDPEIQKDFVNGLYDHSEFIQAASNSLNDDGILLIQVGQAPLAKDPPEQHSKFKNRLDLTRTLVSYGFEHIQDYEEAHCGFYLPWQFMVAFKDFETKASWFTNEAQINLKIHQRSIPTVDGTPPFKYFDGASMMEYLFPSKTSEIVYCRRNPTPAGCDKGHGFEIDRIEFPIDDLYVGPSSLGEKAGRGTFTSRDLPAKSYVGLRELVHAVYADPATYRLIRHWRKPRKHWTFEKYWGPTVWSYIDGYGHAFNRRGGHEIYVDAFRHTFINHACDGKNNVGHDLTVTEKTADPDHIADELVEKIRGKEYIHNPLEDRQVHFFSCGTVRRAIKKGEELLDNYLGMSGSASGYPGFWKTDVLGLKAQCQGEGIGLVSAYENSAKEDL